MHPEWGGGGGGGWKGELLGGGRGTDHTVLYVFSALYIATTTIFFP